MRKFLKEQILTSISGLLFLFIIWSPQSSILLMSKLNRQRLIQDHHNRKGARTLSELNSTESLRYFKSRKTLRSVVYPKEIPTLFDLMHWSPPGSSVHGIFQARILGWVAISFLRGFSQRRG